MTVYTLRGRREERLMEKLSAGLSEKEIRRVLTGSLTVLGRSKLDLLFAKLGPETGRSLRRILHSSRQNRELRRSPDKIRQEWTRAWEEWDDRFSAAGDEQGPYVSQDADWEQPYFDHESLISDLEPIAAKMGKLLPRVFDEGLDPEFSFAEAVKKSVEDFSSSLPEWLNPFETDGFGLGPQATACLLDWERRADRPAFQLIDDLRRLEADIGNFYLDEGAVVRFVRSLSTEDKKEIQRGMRSNRQEAHWRKALDNARSTWFRIYKELSRGHDRAGYLENCEAKIDQDWTLALPVIRNLQSRKDHSKVVEVCGRALRSVLGSWDAKTWDPKEKLIGLWVGRAADGKPDAGVIQILRAWEESAEAMGQADLAAAIHLQADLLPDWRNWDKALSAFRRQPMESFPKMRECLYEKWRVRVTEESMQRCVIDSIERAEISQWIPALADAARKSESGSTVFSDQIRPWLRQMDEGRAAVRISINDIARLTLDLDGASWLRRESPTLVRLLAYGWNDDPALRASRRKWLEHSGGPALIPDLLGFWRRNTERLVPDPKDAESSNYDRCADWVRALHEIQPASGRKLLAGWSTLHRRRKNLWCALRKRGLPVPGAPTGKILPRQTATA